MRRKLTKPQLAEALRYNRDQLQYVRQQIERATARAASLWQESCQVCERARRVREHLGTAEVKDERVNMYGVY